MQQPRRREERINCPVAQNEAELIPISPLIETGPESAGEEEEEMKSGLGAGGVERHTT